MISRDGSQNYSEYSQLDISLPSRAMEENDVCKTPPVLSMTYKQKTIRVWQICLQKMEILSKLNE